MFDWLAQGLLAFVKSLPVLFADESSPNFMLIRTMLGLLLIALIIYLIALKPFRSAAMQFLRSLRRLINRNP